jgi:hypothetical protein
VVRHPLAWPSIRVDVGGNFALYLVIMTSAAVVLLALVSVLPAFAAPTCLGPTPYLKKADSPFDLSGVGVNFFFDDFESATRVVGATASTGSRVGPENSSIADSVDEDDGMIDGSGLQGHSWFASPGSTGVTFTFDAQTLGGLPTAAGIVWTDGGGTVSFEALGADGTTILCASGPVSDPGVFPDGAVNGGTAEDRFFGIYEATGISSITLSNTSGGIEMDHLQFGLVGLAGTCAHAPTFESILCLLDQLVADVGNATDLGRLKSGLLTGVKKARKQAGKASGATGKVARNQVKKASHTLKTFEHKLDSNNAKRLIPAATRDRLTQASSEIRSLLDALRGSL